MTMQTKLSKALKVPRWTAMTLDASHPDSVPIMCWYFIELLRTDVVVGREGKWGKFT